MELNRIDLNLLVAFDVLMTERNLTRAAEVLSIGQPAMSGTLNRLRRVLDDPILVRTGTAWVPTAAAESLIEPVHQALQAIETALATRRCFDPREAQRTFTVMASDYATIVLIGPLHERLADEAPGVRLVVVPPEPHFEERLRAGTIDLALYPREGTSDHPRLASSFLFEDRYVCAVSADNDEVGDELTMSEFLRLPFVAFGGMGVRSITEMQFEQLGIERPIDIITQSFVVGPLLVAGTRFISLVHERLARCVAERGVLRLLEPPLPLKPLTMAMFWDANRTADSAHVWFRSLLDKVAADAE